MVNSTSTRKARTKLYIKQFGLCRWCRRPMTLVGVLSNDILKSNPLACTLDHIRRTRRGKVPYKWTVAACYECNQERSKKGV